MVIAIEGDVLAITSVGSERRWLANLDLGGILNRNQFGYVAEPFRFMPLIEFPIHLERMRMLGLVDGVG